MSNATLFFAIQAENPQDRLLFYTFESMSWHDIWEEVIPDHAPNDLRYRLEYGPEYAIMQYDDNLTQFVPHQLRPPTLSYENPKLYLLVTESSSVFEFGELRLIRDYIQDYLDSPNQTDDFSLVEVIKDFHDSIVKILETNGKQFDAILLEYEI